MYMNRGNNGMVDGLSPRIVSPTRSAGYGNSRHAYNGGYNGFDRYSRGYNGFGFDRYSRGSSGFDEYSPRSSRRIRVYEPNKSEDDDDESDEGDEEDMNIKYCKKLLRGKDKGYKTRKSLANYLRTGKDEKGESIGDKLKKGFRKSRDKLEKGWDKFTNKVGDWVDPDTKFQAPNYGDDSYSRYVPRDFGGFYNSTGNVRGSRYVSISPYTHSSGLINSGKRSSSREKSYNKQKFDNRGSRSKVRMYASDDDDEKKSLRKRVEKLEDKLDKILDKLSDRNSGKRKSSRSKSGDY